MKLFKIDVHTNKASSLQDVLDIVNLYDEVQNLPEKKYFSAGIPPTQITDAVEGELDDKINNIGILLEDDNVIALGEIGLDKTLSVDYNTQMDAFVRQLNLLKNKKQMPIIIHCVQAVDDVLSTLKQYAPNNTAIFHSFTDTAENAQKIFDAGHYVSLYRNTDDPTFQAEFKNFSMQNIFIETDGDTTININQMYERISCVYNVAVDVLENHICHSFKKVFGMNVNNLSGH